VTDAEKFDIVCLKEAEVKLIELLADRNDDVMLDANELKLDVIDAERFVILWANAPDVNERALEDDRKLLVTDDDRTPIEVAKDVERTVRAVTKEDDVEVRALLDDMNEAVTEADKFCSDCEFARRLDVMNGFSSKETRSSSRRLSSKTEDVIHWELLKLVLLRSSRSSSLSLTPEKTAPL
jgi:hypothetical protein